MAKRAQDDRRLPLLPVDKGPIREDRTPGVTGHDATFGQAEYGDAGNGADPYTDLVGGVTPLEDEGNGADIGPDEVRLFPRESDEEEEEREITAQPNDPVPQDPFGPP